ncbi:MAG: tetratricopeptide repeat protein [Anaerolineae bacterium]|nr:tetratricopeptide repeat protein [Anaerolineae bacterium]
MSKSHFVKSKSLTKYGQLQEQLTQLEALIGQLGHGLGEEAFTIPTLFDQITTTLAELQAAGQNTPGESSRFEGASAELQRKAALFLREIGGAGVLQNARSTHKPNPAHWWWYLDHMLVEKRWAQLRRWLVGGVLVVAILVILSLVYQQFLAPDPAVTAYRRHHQSAEALARNGNWEDALNEVERALATLPDNPDGLVLRGILEQKLGQAEEAEELFAVAETRLGGREQLLVVRSEQFLKLDQSEAALADAQELIVLNADSAVGYLFLGQAYANLGNYAEAIAALQEASTLAESQDNPELAASIRVRLAMIIQMIPASATGTPQ